MGEVGTCGIGPRPAPPIPRSGVPGSAPGDADHVDRLLEALEALRARARRAEAGSRVLERLRAHEDLARPRGCADPRREMDRLAAVGVRPVALERLTGVRSDPDVRRDDLGLERALDADRRLERRLRGGERREEAVSRL